MQTQLAWLNERAPKHNFPCRVSPKSFKYSSKGAGVTSTPKHKLKGTKSDKNGQ